MRVNREIFNLLNQQLPGHEEPMKRLAAMVAMIDYDQEVGITSDGWMLRVSQNRVVFWSEIIVQKKTGLLMSSQGERQTMERGQVGFREYLLGLKVQALPELPVDQGPSRVLKALEGMVDSEDYIDLGHSISIDVNRLAIKGGQRIVFDGEEGSQSLWSFMMRLRAA